jgi:hypothetical protein
MSFKLRFAMNQCHFWKKNLMTILRVFREKGVFFSWFFALIFNLEAVWGDIYLSLKKRKAYPRVLVT